MHESTGENRLIKILSFALAGILIVAAVLLAVFKFSGGANATAKKLGEKMLAMENYDFTMTAQMHVEDEDYTMQALGTSLGTNKQAEAIVALSDASNASTFAVTVDDRTLYVNTRDMFKVVGPYLLGDVENTEYFALFYDMIFDKEYTTVSLNTFAMPTWDKTYQWVSELQWCADVLMGGAQDGLGKQVKFTKVENGVTLTLDSDMLCAALDAMNETVAINIEEFRQHLHLATGNYAVETANYSSELAGSLSDMFEELSDGLLDDEVVTAEDWLDALDEVVTTLKEQIREEQITFTCTLTNVDGKYTIALVLTNGEDTYEITWAMSETENTTIGEVPDDAATLEMQVDALNDYVNGIGSAFESDEDEADFEFVTDEDVAYSDDYEPIEEE